MFAITGATGHTGNVVARRLIEHGEQVRVIGRDMRRLQPLAELGARPFEADLTDAGTTSRAFAGATAVYLVMPNDMASKNYRAFQDHVTESVASALAVADVEYVVILSSIGADKTQKTGPVVGLHDLEKRLDMISNLNVLHLRAGYFMENMLAQSAIIHTMNVAAGPLGMEVKLPMIATVDIGNAAADALLRLDFHGRHTRELLGHSDLSMSEAAAIIGKVIGKSDLAYFQLEDDQVRTAMMQMGMSANVANLILEMSAAMNSGHMRALERRNKYNTTPTSFETFVTEHFLPVYEGRFAAA